MIHPVLYYCSNKDRRPITKKHDNTDERKQIARRFRRDEVNNVSYVVVG